MLLMSTSAHFVGAAFGLLSFLAVENAPAKNGSIRWRMRCECGVIKTATSAHVRSGQTKSCGCYRSAGSPHQRGIDLNGQIFGRLLVIDRVGSSPHGAGVLWRCRCDCGKETLSVAARLRGGWVVSCGCASMDQPGLSPTTVRSTRSANRRRGNAAGSFTAAQIDALYLTQRGRCACCRVKLNGVFHRDHRTALANGGTNDIGNIELPCGPCNLRKGAKDEIAWAAENGRLL